EGPPIPWPHERRPGERDLVLEDAVGLGRVTAGLVHQEREKFWSEYQRRGSLFCQRRVKRRLRVVAVARRARHEVELLDELPSSLAREPAVVALRGLRAAFRRRDRDTRAGLDDLLRDIGALARDQALARPVCGDRGAALPGIRSLEVRVGALEQRDALLDRDAEWVARELRPVLALLRRDRRQRDRLGARRRGCLGAAEGFVHEPGHRRLAGAVGRGEAPGAF